MSECLTIESMKKMIKDEKIDSHQYFLILKNVALAINDPAFRNNLDEIQEIIIRLLEQKENFPNYEPILNGLVKEIGLYPYLDDSKLGVFDRIAYEYHRPLELQNIVFHEAQSDAYRALLSGENVILSAPTSFGKSLIIDAMIALKKFSNIVIVVPTIALMDETRRRIFKKFNKSYKIITNINQDPGTNNIFILTPERVLKLSNLEKISFFVIDEFYKLNPSKSDDRSATLNQAFYKLLKTKSQFFLLGPNIGGISVSDKEMNCKFIITNSRTVVSNYIFVKPGDDPFKTLVNLLATLSEPTLIYCRSPSQANQVAFNLLQSPFFEKNSSLADAIKWMKQNYHEKWLLPLSLERGIGIHHGKVPRALSQFCVRAFNEGKINFLICTSSLIEGVNTKAKNVIIFDNKIAANTKIDFFTFNNIAGRSGRMFEHFIGNVYLFHDPPESTLDTVDFPIFSQSDEVAERILLQMEDNDLKDSSKSRLEKYKNQTILSLKTLKENSTVDAQNQIELAKKLIERIEYYHGFLSWTNVPNYYEVNVSSILIWDYLLQPKRSSLGAKSGSQLAFRINRLLQYRDIKTLIELEIEPYKANKNDDVLTINEKIETVLDFIRSWAMFKYPQALMVLDSIQREIFEKYGYKAGNYSKFAATIQNLFLDSSIIELDEYGIPTQVSMKILSSLDPDGNLDHLIKNLKTINFEKETRLNDFEKEIIIDTLSYI